jgi:hypothetical protein
MVHLVRDASALEKQRRKKMDDKKAPVR